MAKGSSGALDTVTKWILGLLIIGFLLVIFLVIVGNLSGNLGFASGTSGYNNTEEVIANFSSGVVTFGGFFGTLFTAAAILAILSIFIALLLLVVSVAQRLQSKGGSGGYGGM